MRVQIVKTGHRTATISLPEGSNVGDALQRANMSSEGCTLAVNSNPATLNTPLSDGQIIQLIGKVKGGSNITVSIVKFGQQTRTTTVSQGSTVKDALASIGFGTDGFTLSKNGSPTTLDSQLNDQDIIQLIPKVKGGK